MIKDFIDVTLLAVLQGVAEFLPISSSGHLVILQHLLDVEESLRMRLEVFLHAGTMMAVFAFYARRISSLVVGMFFRATPEERSEAWLYAMRLLVSTFPAIAVYLVFKDSIEGLTHDVRTVGALLIFTGVVLGATRLMPKGTMRVGWLRALAMGVAQAVALLPGVSRSGMTIAAARCGRVEPAAAAEFSFLMSAPLIIGGTLLELLKGDAGAGDAQMHWAVLLWGTALSAVVGYFSLALLVKALKGRWFWLFGPYCALAGACVIAFC